MRSKSRYVELMHKKSRVSLISRDELANGFVFCCCHIVWSLSVLLFLLGRSLLFIVDDYRYLGTRYYTRYLVQVPGTGIKGGME
jgi:hypothetical protein